MYFHCFQNTIFFLVIFAVMELFCFASIRMLPFLLCFACSVEHCFVVFGLSLARSWFHVFSGFYVEQYFLRHNSLPSLRHCQSWCNLLLAT